MLAKYRKNSIRLCKVQSCVLSVFFINVLKYSHTHFHNEKTFQNKYVASCTRLHLKKAEMSGIRWQVHNKKYEQTMQNQHSGKEEKKA